MLNNMLKVMQNQKFETTVDYFDNSALGSTEIRAAYKGLEEYLWYKEQQQDTTAMSKGRMIHSYLLEGNDFYSKYEFTEFDSFRTAASKMVKARIELSQKTALTTADAITLDTMKCKFEERIQNAGIKILDTEIEKYGQYKLSNSDEIIDVKGRIDLLVEFQGQKYILDLKTTGQSIYTRELAHHKIKNDMIHAQLAHYKNLCDDDVDGAGIIFLDTTTNIFKLCFLTQEYLEKGEKIIQKGIDNYAEFKERDFKLTTDDYFIEF